jgi:GH43 family beta-xylosidase
MPDETGPESRQRFQNPVYPRSFPDPYILKFRGEYFAYCTGHWSDGQVFGVLRSRNLVDWTEVGGAMRPLDSDAPFYWAPEVTYDNGKFYLYYSVGNETLMELRVAVSDRPAGGFVDSGVRLTKEDFAIDAHVFTDDDGQRYLFYATDFLEHVYIGTGTVVDRMTDWYELAGDPQPVTRAKYDWQVYDPNRIEKGGVRWHTVEGPFVLKRKGLYYEMFSGGNWQNKTYGVSFAVSREIENDGEWEQHSDGSEVLPILRTLPGKVVGPGLNSVVLGPNNRELYCVYHSWTDHGRVLAIDRMDFADGRIFIIGPTIEPQPAPLAATISDLFESPASAERWNSAGEWKFEDGEAVCGTGSSRLERPLRTGSFLCETTLRAAGRSETGAFGLQLSGASGEICRIMLNAADRTAAISVADNCTQNSKLVFSDDFRIETFHRMRIDVNGARMRAWIDERRIGDSVALNEPAKSVSLLAEGITAAFAAFSLTEGFEDLFDDTDAIDWETAGGKISIVDGELLIEAAGSETLATRNIYSGAREFCLNIRLNGDAADAQFGFVMLDDGAELCRLSLERRGDEYRLNSDSEPFALPPDFRPGQCRQFAFLFRGDRVHVSLEGSAVADIELPAEPNGFGVFIQNGLAAVEMARLTVL